MTKEQIHELKLKSEDAQLACDIAFEALENYKKLLSEKKGKKLTAAECAKLKKLEYAAEKKYNLALKHKDSYQAAQRVLPGKLVKLIRKARTRNCPEVGTEGIVFWVNVNAWGTEKCGFKDSYGNAHFVPTSACEVIETNPHVQKNEITIPFIGIIESVSRKSVFVTDLNKTTKFWIPKSVCPELDVVSTSKLWKGRAISVSLPKWLATKNKIWD